MKRFLSHRMDQPASSSFSIWWILFAVCLAVGAYLLYTKSGSSSPNPVPVAGAGLRQPQGHPSLRRPPMMHGRQTNNSLMQTIAGDISSFEPPAPVGHQMQMAPQQSQQTQQEPFGFPQPLSGLSGGGGGHNPANNGYTDPASGYEMALEKAKVPMQPANVAYLEGVDPKEIATMGMPSLQRTNANDIDFNAIRAQYPVKARTS